MSKKRGKSAQDQLEILKETREALAQQLKFLREAMDPEKAASEFVAVIANTTDPMLEHEENEWAGGGKPTGGC